MENGIQVIKGGVAVAGGVLAGFLGGFDSLVKLYLALMAVDFMLGLLKGGRTKNLSSAIALWGFINKVIALLIVVLCVLLDEVFALQAVIRNMSIIWFSICEGASILENLAIIGVPFPEGLREVLVQAKKGFSINFVEIVNQIIKNHKALPGTEQEDEQ